jgi:hypothetical protein
MVGDAVGHAGPQREALPVAQLRFQLAFLHEENVAAVAPMDGEVAQRLLDHAEAQPALLRRRPSGRSSPARVLRLTNRDGKGAGGQLYQSVAMTRT